MREQDSCLVLSSKQLTSNKRSNSPTLNLTNYYHYMLLLLLLLLLFHSF